jgi:hypothetical protein
MGGLLPGERDELVVSFNIQPCVVLFEFRKVEQRIEQLVDVGGGGERSIRGEDFCIQKEACL